MGLPKPGTPADLPCERHIQETMCAMEALQDIPEKSAAMRYEALIRVAQVINEHRDCEELFRSLARELHSVVDFDYVAVVLCDAEANRACFHLLDPEDLERPLPKPQFESRETFGWWVYEHQQPLVIPFLRQETRFPQMVRFLLDNRIESTCAVPLTTAHRRLGTLGFGSGQPDAYSNEEVRLLRSVADVVALAIDDALNFEASRRAQEELQREKDRIAELKDQIAQEKLYLEDEIRSEMYFEDIIGVSPALNRVLKLAETVAPTDSTVLISGEFPASTTFPYRRQLHFPTWLMDASWSDS